MTFKRILGGEWQGNNRLQLKRIAHDNRPPGPPQRASGSFRCGLSCFIDKQPTDGRNPVKWKQSVKRSEGCGNNRNQKKKGIPCSDDSGDGSIGGKIAAKDIRQGIQVLAKLFGISQDKGLVKLDSGDTPTSGLTSMVDMGYADDIGQILNYMQLVDERTAK